jgi:hypothetical protein
MPPPKRRRTGAKRQRRKRQKTAAENRLNDGRCFTYSKQHSHAGRKAAPNCRFDGSVAVNFVSASCRQCGNFGGAWNVAVNKFKQ